MQEYLSPGVITENFKLDFARKPAFSVRGAFVGSFTKGPINEPTIITTTDELISVFGKPQDTNYNDWYQVRNFLKYHPGCWVVRSANLDYDFENVATVKLSIAFNPDDMVHSLKLNDNPYKFTDKEKELLQSFNKYDRFTFGSGLENGKTYVVTDTSNFDFLPPLDETINSKEKLIKVKGMATASLEIPTYTEYKKSTNDIGNPSKVILLDNIDDFDYYKDSLGVINVNSPLVIYAKSPGTWGNNIKICIAKKEDFQSFYNRSDLTKGKMAFNGFIIDNIFSKQPKDEEYGLAILHENMVKETFIISLDPNQKDKYIENVINTQSNLIKVNYMGGDLYSTCSEQSESTKPLKLLGGNDNSLSISDIAKSTHVFDDKDTYNFDVLIGNELDLGMSAITCAMARQDIVAVVGASLDNFKCNEPIETVNNLIKSRLQYKELNNCCCCDESVTDILKTSYAVYIGNYLKIYDEYNKKYRFINCAGDVAGLRARTNNENGVWFASAGYNRGMLKTNISLFFNPTKAHRDLLYSNSINPIFRDVDGIVLLGNRTLDELESNFSSWHVRQLINSISYSLENVLKRFLMENINDFTMRQVVSSIQPLLQEIQTGGGLEEFRVRCDNTNNTTITRQNNELHVDVIMKPTGVAEFIVLQLVNTGNSSFSNVINNLKYERN